MGITGGISFPGITAPQHAMAMRTNGARPDAALVFAQPQGTSPSIVGTLFLGFDTRTIVWQNALCDSFMMRITTHGHQQIFRILDSRWQWVKYNITGAYNVRQADGTVQSSTQKTLQQLASMLFSKIAGLTFDVSRITSPEYPMVAWDHITISNALEDLLEPRGYVISLNTDDTVTVWPRGSGNPIVPGTDAVNISISVDPPELPAKLTVVMDGTRVQSKLLTRAVGLDTDGSIKPVDQLSYNPSGVGTGHGWDGYDLVSFNYISDPVAQDLAKRTVGKWFQITSQADGSQNIAAGDVNYAGSGGRVTISDYTQYLPLSNELLETGTDAAGNPNYGFAYVEGTFLDFSQMPPSKSTGPTVNTPDMTRVSSLDWSLDTENGIVKFSQPAMKWNAGSRTFADVFLTCSYSVGNPIIKDRQTQSVTLGGFGEDLEELPELGRTLICMYSGTSTAINSIDDNLGSINSEADEYLNTALNKYQTTEGLLTLARGIYPYNPDGITLQLQWNAASPGNVPFSTFISEQNEVNPLIPTRAMRARLRRLADAPKTSEQRVRDIRRRTIG